MPENTTCPAGQQGSLVAWGSHQAHWVGDGWHHDGRNPITPQTWTAHLRGQILLGSVYTAAETAQVVAIEVDDHGGSADAPRAAQAVIAAFRALGIEPQVSTSKGGKGYHVRGFLGRPVPRDEARRAIAALKKRLKAEHSEICASYPQRGAGGVLGLPLCGLLEPGHASTNWVKPGGGRLVDPDTLELLPDTLQRAAFETWEVTDAADPGPLLALAGPEEALAPDWDDEPASEAIVVRCRQYIDEIEAGEGKTWAVALATWSFGLSFDQRLEVLTEWDHTKWPTPWNPEQLRRKAEAVADCGRAKGWRLVEEAKTFAARADLMTRTAAAAEPGAPLPTKADLDCAKKLKDLADSELTKAKAIKAVDSSNEAWTAFQAAQKKAQDADLVYRKLAAYFAQNRVKAPVDPQGMPRVLRRNGQFWLRDKEALTYSEKIGNEGDLLTRIWERRAEFPELIEPPKRDQLPDFSRVVETVEWGYSRTTTTYDPETRTLYTGLILAPIEPCYDPVTEEWLEAIAGERLDDMCRQIYATKPEYLDAPSRTTVVVGPKDIGKALIAKGCAWLRKTKSIDLGAVITRFNGPMIDSPIWLADERLPKDLSGEQFRSITTERDHLIELKGREKTWLRGCGRIVLSINDLDKLHLLGTKGADDVDAIADRLAVFSCTESDRVTRARAALARLQMKDGSTVDLPRIASHFAWIWTQTQFTPTQGRFLGATSSGPSIILQAELDEAEDLWEVLAEHLRLRSVREKTYSVSLTPVPIKGRPAEHAWAAAPVVVNDGKLYVRPSALAAVMGWTTKEIRKAVKPLQNTIRWQKRVNEKRVWHGYELQFEPFCRAIDWTEAELKAALKENTVFPTHDILGIPTVPTSTSSAR